MGLQEIQKKLHEMQINATGASGEAVGALLSLTPAAFAGLVNAIQGKSFTEAADEVTNKWAATGKKIGRERSDLIVGVLKDAGVEIVKYKITEEKKKRQ